MRQEMFCAAVLLAGLCAPALSQMNGNERHRTSSDTPFQQSMRNAMQAMHRDMTSAR
jgi:hypothetical protein